MDTFCYSYDTTYQLTGADHDQSLSIADEAYSYDKVGNRLTTADLSTLWTYTPNNELQTTPEATYSYDANGNTIQKTQGNQITNYHYNARNRLSKVDLPDGSSVTYAYDPFGRRIKKTITPSAGEGATTYYLYSDEGLAAEYGTSGSLQSLYGWKPNGLWGTDPLYLAQGGKTYYYHNDHLGTPQKLTDAAGAVVWSGVYLSFGECIVATESTITSNLRFPGQYYDQETGLHYNFQRTYDPRTGRYIQSDPIGFAGGGAKYISVCGM